MLPPATCTSGAATQDTRCTHSTQPTKHQLSCCLLLCDYTARTCSPAGQPPTTHRIQQRLQLALYEHLFSVKEIYVAVSHLAVHQQQQPRLAGQDGKGRKKGGQGSMVKQQVDATRSTCSVKLCTRAGRQAGRQQSKAVQGHASMDAAFSPGWGNAMCMSDGVCEWCETTPALPRERW